MAGSALACGWQPTYPVVCSFPLFVALRDHYPPSLQTNAQTSRHAAQQVTLKSVPHVHTDIHNKNLVGCMGFNGAFNTI